MVIGLLTMDIYIPMASSLKEKRSVVKSIVEQCKNKFNVSIAEVDKNDLWKNSTIGVVTISNERVYVNRLLLKVLNYVENFYEVDLINHSIEII